MAKIKIESKQDFLAYAKRILKEELQRLTEAKGNVKGEKSIKLSGKDSESGERIEKADYSKSAPAESEMKKAEKREKEEDVRNELESTDAIWNPNTGFQKRQPHKPSVSSGSPNPAVKPFRKEPVGDLGSNTSYGEVGDKDVSLVKKPLSKSMRGADTYVTSPREEDPDKMAPRNPTVGKDFVGKDRTAVAPKSEPLNINVSGASEETQEEFESEKQDYLEDRGIKSLVDFRSYLGRMLKSGGVDKTKLRTLVTAINNDTGETEDAMLEDLSSEALINLVMQQPSILNGAKYTSFEDFVEEMRGNTPVGQMYDPEMDRKDYSFELGDVLPKSTVKAPKKRKEEDRLEVSVEDVAKQLGMAKGGVSEAERQAIRKVVNMDNNSFMRKAEMESAKLSDLATDFLVEYDDQISSGEADSYAVAFDQFLKLLVSNGWVGGYINQLLSKGKVGGKGVSPQGILYIMTHMEDLATRARELAVDGRKPSPKSEVDMFAAKLIENPLVLELMVEERDALMDLFEVITGIANDIKENTPEEDFLEEDYREELWDEIQQVITTRGFDLHTQRDRVSAAATPEMKVSQTQEDALKKRLRARTKPRA